MLNQKQLFIASRLHQAATKAGIPFDLAEFSRNRTYALAELSALASQLTEANDKALLVEAIVALQDPIAPVRSRREGVTGTGARTLSG